MKEKKELKKYVLIKAVDKRYFDSFVNEGEICFNTAKWFRDYESQDDNIGDAGEGAIASCAKDFTIQTADPIVSCSSKEDLDEQLRTRNWSKPVSGHSFLMFDKGNANILSFYAITISDLGQIEHKHVISRKFIGEFCNHRFVLIKNPGLFISKVEEALKNLGKKPQKGEVFYYPEDNSMRSNLSYYHKREKYSYQSEYRITYKGVNPQKQVVKIGSLKDMIFELDVCKTSYRYDSRDLKLTIEIDFKDNCTNTMV